MQVQQTADLKYLHHLIDHPDYLHLKRPDFFRPAIYGFESPLAIPDMEKAVEILDQNKEAGILVVGDRDVDGVTSTALLGSFLKEIQGEDAVELLVSDDGDDYGLSGTFFERIAAHDAGLIITLDMGSAHSEQIEALLEAGKKVIIIDHHQIPHEIGSVFSGSPAAHLAFVNPMRNPSRGDWEHEGKIATAGLVWKFLLAYGLFHTSAWSTIHMLPLEDGLYCGYRMGFYLGKFDLNQTAVEEIQIMVGEQVNSKLDINIWKQSEFETLIKKAGAGIEDLSIADYSVSPEMTDLGRILLGHQIQSRQRLLDFILKNCDLASIGLVTDMVPLVGENRSLVRLGLGLENRSQRKFRPGYGALLDSLRLPRYELSSRSLGWSVGPVLNAAGRMGKTALAVELLTCPGEKEARLLSRDLLTLNEKRKKRTCSNEEIVADQLKRNPQKLEHPVIFCYDERLEPGVSGIVATRLVEQYNKPVFFLSPDGAHARGSARSVEGVNILGLLEMVGDHFIQFGGHPEAAGFSIAYESIATLEQAILQSAYEYRPLIEYSGIKKDIISHIKLTSELLNWNLIRELDRLEPFGPGNPEPTILLENAFVQESRIMKSGKHVRFRLQNMPAYVEGVMWGGAGLLEQGSTVSITGSLEKNYFPGFAPLRFRVSTIL